MKQLLTTLISMGMSFCLSAQVTLQAIVPPVGVMQKAQLWNMMIINGTGNQYDCRIDLVLKDRASDMDVLTATSNVFILGTGAKQLSIGALSPVQYNYTSLDFDNQFQGLIPVGSYTVCYTLRTVDIKAQNLADECVQFDVEPLSPPVLITPADSAVLEIAPAQFSWIPPGPAGMFSRLSYDVLIVPVNEGQPAAEALQQNLPFYNDGNIQSNFLNYPAALPAFEKDKWYAWQVVAKDDKNYASKTETWLFKINKTATIVKPETAVYLLLKDKVEGVFEIASDVLHVKYFSSLKDYKTALIFSDDKGNVIKSDKKLIKQGDNFFDFKVDGKFRPGRIYTLSIIDANKKEHSLSFNIHTK